MGAKIDIPKANAEDFRRRNCIRRLPFFRSALRDDFSPSSDL